MNLHVCKCRIRQAKETYIVALVDSAASIRSVDPRGYWTITSFDVPVNQKNIGNFYIFCLPKKNGKEGEEDHFIEDIKK